MMPPIWFSPGMSAAVNTRSTPGWLARRSASTRRWRPWATGDGEDRGVQQPGEGVEVVDEERLAAGVEEDVVVLHGSLQELAGVDAERARGNGPARAGDAATACSRPSRGRRRSVPPRSGRGRPPGEPTRPKPACRRGIPGGAQSHRDRRHAAGGQEGLGDPATLEAQPGRRVDRGDVGCGARTTFSKLNYQVLLLTGTRTQTDDLARAEVELLVAEEEIAQRHLPAHAVARRAGRARRRGPGA